MRKPRNINELLSAAKELESELKENNMANELVLGISPMTEKIYLGKLNKAKTMWLAGKKDITNNFLDVLFQYLTLNDVREIVMENESTKKLTTHLFLHCEVTKDSLERNIQFLQKELEKTNDES